MTQEEANAIIDAYANDGNRAFIMFAIQQGVRKQWLDDIDTYRNEIMNTGVDPDLAKALTGRWEQKDI